MAEGYHVHISAKDKRFHLDLAELWRYRDLIVLLTKKAFTLTYKQTVLGPAWIVITPLISSIAYMLVFGVIAGISTDGVPQVLFYLASTGIWGLFSGSLASNSSIFRNNAYLYTKVYFPRLCAPISSLITALIQFCIQMIMVLLLIVFFTVRGDIHPDWIMWLTIPLALVHLQLLGLGVGLILTSFTTKYRDLQIIVGFGLQLWMFATPVVYPLSQVPSGPLRTAMLFNPVTSPVEWLRSAMFGVGTINPMAIAASLAVTLVLMLIGIYLFNRVEKTFVDTV